MTNYTNNNTIAETISNLKDHLYNLEAMRNDNDSEFSECMRKGIELSIFDTLAEIHMLELTISYLSACLSKKVKH